MTENQELLSEAEVDFLLQAAGQDTDGEAPQLDTGYQTVTMHGDLDQIHLADIFQTLSMSKMEGVLRVRNPLDERQIYCLDGHVRILIPLRVSLRRLGQRLMHAGILNAEELRAAIIEYGNSSLTFGELLIRDQIISQEQLESMTEMQASEDLFSLFTWRRGTFEFFRCDGDNTELRHQFTESPEYEISSLLLEIARRSDEWETILGAVQSLDEVARQIAQPASPDDLDDPHVIVLEALDGKHTIRQLADQSTIGLFAFARAARDLVAGGIADLIDDPTLTHVAAEFVEDGEPKMAIMLLQTLRDRPGDRSIGVIKSMATVLEQAGERRFASTMLLEAAQRSPVAEEALELARNARQLVPYDPGTLSFLRTVLVAHADSDSAELEKCTIDLVDALIDNDRISTALEICDDARRTGSMRPQILTREARARQKGKDIEGAIATLMEIADFYKQAENRPKAIEALKAVQRLDRNRKDVQRALLQMSRTRLGNAMRACAALLIIGLFASMGLVWWERTAFEESLQEANREVQDLLDQGDRNGAEAKLNTWTAALGACDGLEDLAIRVAFAQSAESNRLKILERTRSNQQLTAAATAIGQGQLKQALEIYELVHAQESMRKEVQTVVSGRLNALSNELLSASQSLRSRTPPNPDELFDRAEVTANLATLQESCPPVLMQCYDALRQMTDADGFPAFIGEATRLALAETIDQTRPDIENCRRLASAYNQALRRNDIQRRLDPMFKAAVEKEANYDFAGALELYRMLESQPSEDIDLRTHFRDQVTRNATITRLLKALHDATIAGDYETATQHLRALRVSFPKVPFDQLARLPVHVASQPKNATVTVNGQAVGKTPIVLSRIPSQKTKVLVTCEGFQAVTQTITGDAQGTWTARLLLEPLATWQPPGAIETPPTKTNNGDELFVDRSGNVILQSAEIDQAKWTFASNDLSGWLTTPLLDRDLAIVGSLDGTLRAIHIHDGELAWHVEGLSCEVQPTIIGRTLVLATTDKRLHAINLDTRAASSIDIPERVIGGLLAYGEQVIAIGAAGLITCWSVPTLSNVWRQSLANVRSPHASLAGGVLVCGDDQGNVVGVDATSGTVRWSRDLQAALFGGPTVANQKVVCVSNEQIYRLNAETGEPVDGFSSVGSDWAGSAVVAGNRMVVPLRSNTLQVIDAETGNALYRIFGGRKSRVFQTHGKLFVFGKDRILRSYGNPR